MRIFTALLILTTWFSFGLSIIQIYIFGNVILPGITYKIILAGFLSIYCILFFYSKGLRIPKNNPMARYLFYWVSITSVNLIILYLLSGYSIQYIIFAHTVLYFYIFILFILMIVRWENAPSISAKMYRDKLYTPIIIFIASLVIALGFFQAFFDIEIINTNFQESDYLQLKSISFLSTDNRAHSIFSSGLGFGEFCCFIYFIILSRLLSIKRVVSLLHLKNLLIVLSLLACTYALVGTFTRNIYILTILGTAFMIANRTFKISNLQNQFISLVCLFFGIIFILSVDINYSDSYINTASVASRLMHWNNAILMFDDASLLEKIFGLGLIANDRYLHTAGLTFDNIYIAILIFSGLWGLLITIILLWIIQNFSINLIKVDKTNHVYQAVAAFWFALPTIGFVNVQINTPLLLLCFAICFFGSKNISYMNK